MLSLFSYRKKEYLTHQKDGVVLKKSGSKPELIPWTKIKKLVFVSIFEEYSGYFLTEEFKKKVLYKEIHISCKHNVVKIRTGGSPSVKKNKEHPFSQKYGLTSLYHVVFVTYLNTNNEVCLYGAHFKNDKKEELFSALEKYLPKENVFVEKTLEGFNALYNL